MSETANISAPEVEQAETATPVTDAPAAFGADLAEGFDVAVPEAVRAVAEQVVNQSREAYERSKGAMEDTVEMLEQSIDKAGQGVAAINRKVIDITQTNLNSGFDLAKELAGAKNLAEVMEFQAAYARKQFETFSSQAEEIRNISTQIATDTTDPFKAHVTRSIESLKVN